MPDAPTAQDPATGTGHARKLADDPGREAVCET